MTTLNESRAWADASARPTFCPGERRAYERATTSTHGVVTFGDTTYSPDALLAAEDATAERHGNPLVTAASAIVGLIFAGMVALTVWGWLG